MPDSHENAVIKCPICGSEKFTLEFKLKDYSISQENFALSSCSNCNLRITTPQPVETELPRYYESETYISHSATRRGIINKLYHRVQQQNLKQKYNGVKKFVPRGTWMDYGAGNGAFMDYLSKKRVPVNGFEPDENARKIARSKGVEINDSKAYKTNANAYAAITMWHVLEHVPNLHDLLKTHHTNLIENGILVIAVPNHKSYDAQFYKKYWAGYDVPRHLWHFDEENIIRLLSQHHFTHIQTRPMIFDSFYVSMLSEKYKKGFLLKGFIIGALSNLKAALKHTPYSSQIYIFRKKTI